jgi:U3 small nucleolar RNA-associated protein 4
LCEK